MSHGSVKCLCLNFCFKSMKSDCECVHSVLTKLWNQCWIAYISVTLLHTAEMKMAKYIDYSYTSWVVLGRQHHYTWTHFEGLAGLFFAYTWGRSVLSPAVCLSLCLFFLLLVSRLLSLYLFTSLSLSVCLTICLSVPLSLSLSLSSPPLPPLSLS